MVSLKKSMKWDEDTFGLEYDLDVYNGVFVDCGWTRWQKERYILFPAGFGYREEYLESDLFACVGSNIFMLFCILTLRTFSSFGKTVVAVNDL